MDRLTIYFASWYGVLCKPDGKQDLGFRIFTDGEFPPRGIHERPSLGDDGRHPWERNLWVEHNDARGYVVLGPLLQCAWT